MGWVGALGDQARRSGAYGRASVPSSSQLQPTARDANTEAVEPVADQALNL
jgi:hypothetical protein